MLAAMGVALLLSAGLAFAATYDCTAGRACVGTEGPDTLNGSSGVDPYMDGRQDDDELFANGGEYAYLQGDAFDAPDNDTTTDGDDTFSGGARGDFIFAEETSQNKGEDTVNGGRGNDYIEARDEVRDTINCGRGTMDVVFFDMGGIDTVKNCEYKNKWPDFEEFSSAAASSDAPEKVSAKKLDALRAR